MHSPFLQRAEGGTNELDREHVLYALGLLMDPKQTFELRGITSGEHGHADSRVCKGSNLAAAVDAAWEISDNMGVYFCLNPVRHDLRDAAKKADIVSRRWMLIDVDTQRKDNNSNATESEKAHSRKIADAVLDYLVSAHGWPNPLLIDSGNGYHLLYRIDLPKGDLSQQLIKAFLKVLGEKFDTPEAKIDRGVHRDAQLSKLPGTWARKGPHSPERPQRIARIIWTPSELIVVTHDQINAIAKISDTPRQELNGHSPFLQSVGGGDMTGYVKSAVERECGRLMMTTDHRNDQLNACAHSLGKYAAWPEMDSSWAKGMLRRAAIQCGLGQSETDRTIESGWTSGALKPKAKPAKTGLNGHAKFAIDPTSRLIILASEVTPKKVEWLWENRIPLGKLTTFAGWGGLGKSFVTMDLAARISTGGGIPGLEGMCFEQGNVLILNTEDDPEDTSVPRLIEAGADLRRVGFARSEVLGQFTLGDLATLDQMLDQLGGAKLLVIDPATAHLGDADDHKNAELRALLMPLSLWAMERSLAVVLVTHVNKPQAGKVEAMARVVGSVAWVNAVRAAVMFSKDPNDSSRRLFIPFKTNNAPEQKGLSYRVLPTDSLAKVEWLGEVDTTADEAMAGSAKKSRGLCAVEWLTERFRESYEWESDALRKAANEAGISKNALWSPEVNALPIKKKRRTDAAGDPKWWWIADQGWPENNGNDGNVGILNRSPY